MPYHDTLDTWKYSRDPVLVWNSKLQRMVPRDPTTPVTTGVGQVFVLGAHRSAVTRRVKPKGIDLLFQGQAYERKRVIVRMPPFQFSGLPAKYKLQGGGDNTVYLGKEHGTFNIPTGGFSSDPLYNTPGQTGYAGNEAALTFMYNTTWTGGRLSDNELRNLLGDQKLDMLTNAVELRKTARMFQELGKPLLRQTGEYVTDLRRYLRQERRRFSGHAALGIPGVKLTKKLADLHLAYAFGVKPLIGELEGVYDLLVEANLPVVKVRSTRKLEYSSTILGQVSSHPGEWMSRFRPTTTHRGTIKYHYHLYGELDPLYEWRTLLRVGVNPLATAWELTPWSFAIDRFIDIGGALTSMGALKGYRRTICYETRVHTQESIRMCNISSVQQTCSRKEVSRIIRPLTWSLPRPQFDYGANQVVTYTALLRQQLSRWTKLLK